MTTEPTETTHQEESGDKSVARRGMFAVAAGGFAAALAACGGKDSQPEAVLSPAEATPSRQPTKSRPERGAPATRTRRAPAAAAAPTEADFMIGALAASLEVLAVNTYGAALDAAGAGALGEVPPAVAEYVTTARAHHQAALDAWNGALTAGGKEAVTAPPADLEASVNEQFGMVTDVVGAAQLALTLEQVAAGTYLFAISKLESPEAIALAGSIFPIDRQHISVLLFALGMYPVPEVFANTDMAFSGGAMPESPMMPGTR